MKPSQGKEDRQVRQHAFHGASVKHGENGGLRSWVFSRSNVIARAELQVGRGRAGQAGGITPGPRGPSQKCKTPIAPTGLFIITVSEQMRWRGGGVIPKL